MNVEQFLRDAAQQRVSDILISAGSPLTYHLFGELKQVDENSPMTPEQTKDFVYSFLSPEQQKVFERDWELDMGFEIEGVARFRANVYYQQKTVGAVLRLVPLEVPHYSTIGIPKLLMDRLVSFPNGLILVTGPTGAGKSTTCATFLEYLNTEYGFPRHIVTIEDPIEYPFKPNMCVIDQREIGVDTKGYPEGLKSALRQMPHIIFVGEMRDRETIEIALTAAETGNLVISTLSTQSAAKTINRIIDVFPLHDQAEVRTRLALTLRSVISQALLRRKDVPGRVAAREVLLVNSPVSNLIREAKIHQINNVIASSHAEGMVLLDDSLIELHREGVIHSADMFSRLQDPEKARLALAS